MNNTLLRAEQILAPLNRELLNFARRIAVTLAEGWQRCRTPLTLPKSQVDATVAPLTDTLTILRYQSNLLAKVWRADGTVAAYDQTKFFTPSSVPLAGIADLSAQLSKLEYDPHACVIRGAYRGDDHATESNLAPENGRVRRLLELFDGTPHHWVLVEIDSFEPLTADPVRDPVPAIDEYVVTCLPDGFQGAAYHWQLSNSAGHATKGGILKAHVWFWLATPYTSAQLKACAKVSGIELDDSVLNPVQVHYTAAPVFDAGVVDPVPVRSGFVPGLLDDAVALTIDQAVLDQALALKPRQRGDLIETYDPVADLLYTQGRVLDEARDGGLIIACPWEDEHTNDTTGTDSTVWFPAGTNGYDRGYFKCLHMHCADRLDIEFFEAIYFVTTGFNRLNLGASVTNLIRAFGGQTRDYANRAGLISESIISDMNRWAESNIGRGWTAKLANATMKASLLEAWTDALRRGFSVTMMGALGKMSRGEWLALDAGDRARLARQGVTETDFNVWRLAQPESWRGSDMLTLRAIPEAKLEAAGLTLRDRDRAVSRLLGSIVDESEFASLNQDLYTRAAVTRSTQKGTVAGELLRSIALFKGFPMSTISRHLSRVADQWRTGDKVSSVAYGTGLTVGLTIFGALAIEMKVLVNGKDPRDMTTRKFCLAAFAQGGGLGIFGDALYTGMGGDNRAGYPNWAALPDRFSAVWWIWRT